LIKEAVELDREALKLRPPGHPCRDASLNGLAEGLRSLYEHSKDQQLLDIPLELKR
jgi:hypothetical protein